MARRCASKMLLDVLDETRMITLAPDVRMLWLDIARRMQNDGISVFRFGSEVLKPHGLLKLLSREESETETQLETKITELCARGLLARESDGAISCPMLAAAMTRSEINKANGSKGGRPRKDGAPPGQRTLMLPIDGGAAKTEITEPETDPEKARARVTADSAYKVSKQAVADEVWRAVGIKALKTAGFDEARHMGNCGIVRQWMVDGADEALILDVIAEKTHDRVKTLNYFTAAIAEAVAAKPKPKPLYEKEWEKSYDHWELFRDGPCPRLADFKERFAA